MAEFETVMQTRDEVEGLHNAPINVMPAGGGEQGMGWGFDFFQKFAIKFPAQGQIIPVKCNQISPTRATYCCQSQGRTQERDNKKYLQIKL